MGIYGTFLVWGNAGFIASTVGLCLNMLKAGLLSLEIGVLCLRARGVVPGPRKGIFSESGPN